MSTKEEKEKWGDKKFGIVHIIVYGLAFFCWFLVIRNWSEIFPKDEAQEKDVAETISEAQEKPKIQWFEKDEKVLAYTLCKQEVEDKLVSPSTAKFESVWKGRYERVRKTNQTYLYNSWVDSQNRLGAEIRTKFQCQVTQTEEDKWELDLLNIFE